MACPYPPAAWPVCAGALRNVGHVDGSAANSLDLSGSEAYYWLLNMDIQDDQDDRGRLRAQHLGVRWVDTALESHRLGILPENAHQTGRWPGGRQARQRRRHAARTPRCLRHRGVGLWVTAVDMETVPDTVTVLTPWWEGVVDAVENQYYVPSAPVFPPVFHAKEINHDS